MSVTIKDVARIAGVSPATVSRVINGTKPVSSEVTQKVLETIKKTGFKRNAAARSLVIKKSSMIGVIVTDIANSNYGKLVKGIQNIVNLYNYNIILCDSDMNENKEIEYLHLLQEQRVDGIIMLTKTIKSSHKKIIANSSIPIVLIDRKCEGAYSVKIDNFIESYKAVEYLINLGHKNIGFISGYFEDEASGLKRYKGYKEALEDNKIAYNPKYVCEADFTIKGGYNAAEKLFICNKDLTAIFAASDEMAIGAITCINDMNKKVPEDISIIGFDDIEYAKYIKPKLTTVHQPIYEIGQQATKILIRAINNQSIDNKNLVLNADIVIRDSTRSVKK